MLEAHLNLLEVSALQPFIGCEVMMDFTSIRTEGSEGTVFTKENSIWDATGGPVKR